MKIFGALIGMMVLAAAGVPVFQNVVGQDEKKDAPLAWPISRGEEREKKLTFGLFVTPDPENNPIDPPERFTGYHTALDLEIFPEEESQDVPILAACDGKILQADVVSGYGGVIIQSCMIEGADATVLYGHLDYHRFLKSPEQEVKKGEQIGFLGESKSDESGMTRKHLHFGVHKGQEIEVKGYAEIESELENFLDPFPLLQKSGN